MGILKPTFRVVLDERREKDGGVFPLKLRVTYNRVRKYYNVGMDLTKDEFQKLPTSKLEKLKDIKLRMKAMEVKAENIYKSLPDFSFAAFEKVFLAKTVEVKPVDVYSMFAAYIEKLKGEQRVSTSQSYGNAMVSLKSFKSKLRFEEVTPEFLNAYEQKMLGEGKSTTTVGIYLRSLRTIYNKAIETGLVKREMYPFKKQKFQIPAGENIKKALTSAEIGQIFKFETVPFSSMDKAKDFWIFSYLCGGLNLKDICQLRYSNIDGDNLYVVRAKTRLATKSNQKTLRIPLTPEAANIIQKWGVKPVMSSGYVFDILTEGISPLRERELIQYFNKLLNKYMKDVGESLGILKPITSYSARHSYATVLKRNGVSVEYISETLGHKTTKTTQSYLDSFEDDVKRKYASLLTSFFNMKPEEIVSKTTEEFEIL